MKTNEQVIEEVEHIKVMYKCEIDYHMDQLESYVNLWRKKKVGIDEIHRHAIVAQSLNARVEALDQYLKSVK